MPVQEENPNDCNKTKTKEITIDGNTVKTCVKEPSGLRPCLQGGRVYPSARVTLARESKIARVYKQHFTGRITLLPGTALVNLVNKTRNG